MYGVGLIPIPLLPPITVQGDGGFGVKLNSPLVSNDIILSHSRIISQTLRAHTLDCFCQLGLKLLHDLRFRLPEAVSVSCVDLHFDVDRDGRRATAARRAGRRHLAKRDRYSASIGERDHCLVRVKHGNLR